MDRTLTSRVELAEVFKTWEDNAKKEFRLKYNELKAENVALMIETVRAGG